MILSLVKKLLCEKIFVRIECIEYLKFQTLEPEGIGLTTSECDGLKEIEKTPWNLLGNGIGYTEGGTLTLPEGIGSN